MTTQFDNGFNTLHGRCYHHQPCGVLFYHKGVCMGNASKKILDYAITIYERVGGDFPDSCESKDICKFISDNEEKYIKMIEIDSLMTKMNQIEIKINRRFSFDLIERLIEIMGKNKGIYFFFVGSEIVYIGKSFDLMNRIFTSMQERLFYNQNIDGILIVEFTNDSDLNIAEPYLISKFKPCMNKEFSTKDLPRTFSAPKLDDYIMKSKIVPIFMEPNESFEQ